jgi:hypothetical protein
VKIKEIISDFSFVDAVNVFSKTRKIELNRGFEEFVV